MKLKLMLAVFVFTAAAGALAAEQPSTDPGEKTSVDANAVTDNNAGDKAYSGKGYYSSGDVSKGDKKDANVILPSENAANDDQNAPSGDKTAVNGAGQTKPAAKAEGQEHRRYHRPYKPGLQANAGTTGQSGTVTKAGTASNPNALKAAGKEKARARAMHRRHERRGRARYARAHGRGVKRGGTGKDKENSK